MKKQDISWDKELDEFMATLPEEFEVIYSST
jgi:hypothetical protein